ncbi:hypothetical protein CTEN210_13222 [Chaetoceros tenuissimus]|uniref:Uncharacterized protein n=1 Tax=Chaetoceros tenuissimus TaxID=426638 RepID=A0AAD3HB09_9STRA|nr:hypothetical protein CTEN210_13222 [Chaetoceros tenuissimus]
MIPSTPWDSVWNGVSEWFGITTDEELDYVIPNRNTFSKLLSANDIYGDGDEAQFPTPVPGPSNYVLMERGVGDKCPEGTSIKEDECLAVAKALNTGLSLPDVLNSFTWEDFVPCGCFLFYASEDSVLVDYNAATTGCLAEPRSQLICDLPSEPSPTSSPTNLHSTGTPTISSTNSPNTPTLNDSFEYILMEIGVGDSCPEGKEVQEDECLSAAASVGVGLDLPDWLNSFYWENFVPCNTCFLWHNTDGSILIDYNSATTGCMAEPRAQLICKSQISSKHPTSNPSKTSTLKPSQAPSHNRLTIPSTMIPSVLPTMKTTSPSKESMFKPSMKPSMIKTKQPTLHPSKTPSSTPTSSPSKAPVSFPSSVSTYFMLEKGDGISSCPSGSMAVPQNECLDAAYAAGDGSLNLPDWLNVITWHGLPCGCFLWHNTNGQILVDYNTITAGCGANAYTQMICKSDQTDSGPSTDTMSPTAIVSPPTLHPSKTPTSTPTSSPSKAPVSFPSSVSIYFMLEKGDGISSCPSGSIAVPQSECLDAAYAAGGSSLNLPDWLNVITWHGLPCGCFLWHNTNGQILVDYNTIMAGCGANAYTQMICKSDQTDSGPSTDTMSPTAIVSPPTLHLSKTPTSTPSKAPVSFPSSVSTYFMLEKGDGISSCPSGSIAVPQSECLDAAYAAGDGSLNLPDWLNLITWHGLPCGCFLWHNTNGQILVDYNTIMAGCGANAYTQMICKNL